MPIVGWFDIGRGKVREFDTELDWHDCPIGIEMLLSLKQSIQSDRDHQGTALTTTTCMSPTRKVILERFFPIYADPEDLISAHIGSLVHERLQGILEDLGYSTDHATAEFARGIVLQGAADGWMINPPKNQPNVVELKVTTSGSLRFILEDGAAKSDHICQTNVNRHLIARSLGVDPSSLTAEIRYYVMRQKEKMKGLGFVRIQPAARFAVPFWPVEQILEYHPGGKFEDGSPTFEQNMLSTHAAFTAIESGADPKEIVSRLPCQCGTLFNKTGKNYCDSRRLCENLSTGIRE